MYIEARIEIPGEPFSSQRGSATQSRFPLVPLGADWNAILGILFQAAPGDSVRLLIRFDDGPQKVEMELTGIAK